MSRPQRDQAGPNALTCEPSGRDLAIVGQVGDLRLMSGRQIEAVHFPTAHHDNAAAASQACRRVLVRLVDERLLVRLDRRIGGARAGSSGFVYGLGPKGHRLLSLRGDRNGFREPSKTFALHTLGVAQLVVDITIAARGDRFDVLISQAEPRCWRTFTSIGGLIVLKPDYFVALGVGDFEHRFFVEIDRGTTHLPALIRKCRQYQSYYDTGRERALHGVHPRTCWLMPDADQATRLRRAIDSDKHLTKELFVVSTKEQALETLAGGAP